MERAKKKKRTEVNLEKDREILEKASRVFQFENGSQEFVKMCMEMSKEIFICYESDQESFMCLFQEYMDQSKLNTTRLECKKKDKYRLWSIEPDKTDISLIFFLKSGQIYTKTMTVSDFSRILSLIVACDSWVSSIKKTYQIPHPILKSLAYRSIRPRKVFPNLGKFSLYHSPHLPDTEESVLDSLNCIMSSVSWNLFARKLISIENPPDEPILPEDASFDSESEISITEIMGEKQKRNADTSGAVCFDIGADSQVKYEKLSGKSPCALPRNHNFIRFQGHPYCLSAAVFATCNLAVYNMRLYGNIPSNMDTKRLYHMTLDWLNDQIMPAKCQITRQVHDMMMAVLQTVTDCHLDDKNDNCSYYGTALRCYLYIFKDIYSILRMNHTVQTTRSAKRGWRTKNIKLQKYKILPYKNWKAEFDSYLCHPYYENSKDRQPGLVARKGMLDPLVLVFDIRELSPLKLYPTMKILQYHFNGSDGAWDVFYDLEKCYLLVDEAWYMRWSRMDLPNMMYYKRASIRSVHFPIYPFHLINYFKGGKYGLISCMKFILRTFCGYKESVDSLMMASSTEDPCVEAYSVFHLLMGRFQGYHTMWVHLVQPLSDTANLKFDSKKLRTPKIPYLFEDSYTRGGKLKKKQKKIPDYQSYRESVEKGEIQQGGLSMDTDKIVGLREDHHNIYTAIRAFIHCNSDHFIDISALDSLMAEFTDHNCELQLHHPLVYKLIKALQMIKDCPSSDDVCIPKSGKDFTEKIQEEIDIELFNFPLPLVYILYYFCISQYIVDDFAIFLFESITSKIRKKTAKSSVIFSFPSPNLVEVRHDLFNTAIKATAAPLKPEDMVEKLCGNALSSILSLLEELSFYPVELTLKQLGKDRKRHFRGYREKPEMILCVSPDQILHHSEEIFEKAPLDMKKKDNGEFDFFHCHDSMPIFNAEIIQDQGGFYHSDVKNRLISGHPPPFYYSKDLLECVIMYPIVHVQCISTESCDLPDMESNRNIGSEAINDWCPYDFRTGTHYMSNSATSSPSVKTEFLKERVYDWFLKTLEDRKGWTEYHPPIHKLMMQGVSFASTDYYNSNLKDGNSKDLL